MTDEQMHEQIERLQKMLAKKIDGNALYGIDLVNAIWEAAWFAVNRLHYDKDDFVSLITLCAAESFDAQLSNAATRAKANTPQPI